MHFFYPYVAFYGLKRKGRNYRRRIVSKKAEIKDKKAEICLIIGLLAAQYADSIQVRIIKGDKDINFGSIYENAVAQELVAHGLEPYYYNSKKRGEIDFVIENNGKVLPIGVKSGKGYVYHRALSNIMDCEEYDLPEALVLNNDNLSVDGRITYVPVYMVMFLEKEKLAAQIYKIELDGLK